MSVDIRIPAMAAVVATLLAACGSSGLQTSSIPAPEPIRVDPACQSLAATVDTLRREGVADKIERAAAKKYKMTPADLTKAAQLNRANDDFQQRCSKVPRNPLSAPAAVPTSPPAGSPGKSAVVVTKPAAAAAPAAAPITTEVKAARAPGAGTAAAEARTAAASATPKSAAEALAAAGSSGD